MHKMIVMHISDGTSQVVEDSLGFFFRDSLILDDIVKKLLTWAQLSSDIDKIVILEVFIHLHYIGMILTN